MNLINFQCKERKTTIQLLDDLKFLSFGFDLHVLYIKMY